MRTLLFQPLLLKYFQSMSVHIPGVLNALRVTEPVCSDLITQVSISSPHYMPPHSIRVHLCTFLHAVLPAWGAFPPPPPTQSLPSQPGKARSQLLMAAFSKVPHELAEHEMVPSSA